MKINHFGTLYIVATPLGNRQDISLRAIETLQSVSRIAAEDTRHSLPLLQHFSIHKPLLSLHEHNEREYTGRIVDLLLQGESIALISDAGTPLISDPGFVLVGEARKAGIKVVPVPGPCAAIAALSVAGLPTDRFVFEGFLPVKTKLRKQRLLALSEEPRTLIFYEAPHRILKLLQECQKTFGETRKCVIARELTKIFETVHTGTLAEITEWVAKDVNQQRGEIVLLLEGSKVSPREEKGGMGVVADHVLAVLLENLPHKQAVELAAKITGERKNKLYQTALEIKNPD